MTNEEALRLVIKNSGYRICYIAKEIGLTYQGFLNKVTNKSEFTISEMKRLCDLLRISNEERETIFFDQQVDETSTKNK